MLPTPPSYLWLLSSASPFTALAPFRPQQGGEVPAPALWGEWGGGVSLKAPARHPACQPLVDAAFLSIPFCVILRPSWGLAHSRSSTNVVHSRSADRRPASRFLLVGVFSFWAPLGSGLSSQRSLASEPGDFIPGQTTEPDLAAEAQPGVGEGQQPAECSVDIIASDTWGPGAEPASQQGDCTKCVFLLCLPDLSTFLAWGRGREGGRAWCCGFELMR